MSGTQTEQMKEAKKQHELLGQTVLLKDSFDHASSVRHIGPQQTEVPVTVHDTKRSFSVLKKCKSLIFPATAGDTAEGTPVMQEHKEKTWKEKRADDEHAEEAKKLTNDPKADHYSYEMVRDLKQAKKYREDSGAMLRRAMPDYEERIERCHADRRVLNILMGTYKTDEKGMPIDEENAKLMDLERQRMEDYVSGDLEKRKPILDSLVKEMIDFKFDATMMNIEYISAHVVKMKEIGDKLIYMENVMKDPINKPYFDNMEPAEKELLESALSIAPGFTAYITNIMDIRSVNMNHSDYYYDEASITESLKMNTAFCEQALKTQLMQRDLKQKEIYVKFFGETFRKTLKDCSNPNPDLSGTIDESAVAELKKALSTPKEWPVGTEKVSSTRIQEADRQFELSMSKGNLHEADSLAKQTLGLRDSKQDTAIADKKFKGALFDSLNADYASFFVELKDKELPYDQMAEMLQHRTVSESSPASLELGGGAEAMAVELLSMFKKRTESDAIITYFAESYKAMGSAKIFGIKGEEKRIDEFISFMMLGLMNTNVSTAFSLIKEADRGTSLYKIARAASRNALALPKLVAMLSDEEKAKLKDEDPTVYEMIQFYEEMQNGLIDRVKKALKSEAPKADK